MAIGKPKCHKSPGMDQIPAELINAGGRIVSCEIHKHISIWNKEELPEECKESNIVLIYNKGGNSDFITYRGISILSTAYKSLSNTLLSRLTPYAEEIVGDDQCGFRRERSTIDNILCIRQIFEKKGIRRSSL
jgi:hypothetical protein